MLVASYVKYAALRDSAGVSDYRVAADTGITRSTFTEWREDTFRSRPKVDKLAKLAAYFGVAVDDLLEEQDSPGQ